MNHNVLLIGNGPCVFDKQRGKEIDDFDGRIVRFNGYQIEDYEKYVGIRTNILVIGQLNLRKQLNPQYDYILLYLSDLDGGEGMRIMKELSPHNTIKFFPIYEKDKIKELLDFPRHIEPTTGLIAIHWFMRANIDLYLYGFDFYSRGHNYFSDNINPRHSDCHDSKKEKLYVDYLIDNNIISWF